MSEAMPSWEHANDETAPVLVIDYDVSVWCEVPPLWVEEDWAELGTWSRRYSEACWAPEDPAPGDVEAYADQLRGCGEIAQAHAPGARALLYTPHPRAGGPLTVLVDVLPAESMEPSVALRLLTLADDEDAVRPAVVDSFPSPDLGDGLRVSRAIPGDEDGLFFQLRYAWYYQEYDAYVLMVTITHDLELLVSAVPEIEYLAMSTRFLEPGEVEPLD
ncbi:hypothetical protein [Streptomyces otsuchiensis]|uniref:hypothetical protein n=1 Tax=Streptomyces otsuchiensis TaxID=2681388 RepID=UPI001030FAA1|nr:hypothetical protein [Streptomyces otsuchiensis]